MNVSPPPKPKTLEELETQLLQSVDRLNRGEGVDGEEVFRRLRKRMRHPKISSTASKGH